MNYVVIKISKYIRVFSIINISYVVVYDFSELSVADCCDSKQPSPAAKLKPYTLDVELEIKFLIIEKTSILKGSIHAEQWWCFR